jgi:hypothetical protein
MLISYSDIRFVELTWISRETCVETTRGNSGGKVVIKATSSCLTLRCTIKQQYSYWDFILQLLQFLLLRVCFGPTCSSLRLWPGTSPTQCNRDQTKPNLSQEPGAGIRSNGGLITKCLLFHPYKLGPSAPLFASFSTGPEPCGSKRRIRWARGCCLGNIMGSWWSTLYHGFRGWEREVLGCNTRWEAGSEGIRTQKIQFPKWCWKYVTIILFIQLHSLGSADIGLAREGALLWPAVPERHLVPWLSLRHSTLWLIFLHAYQWVCISAV